MALISSSWKFVATLYFISHGFANACNNTITGSRGVIESPNFPDSYPHNKKCFWTIEAPEGSNISLTFSHFGIESTDNCGADYVEVLEIREHGEHINLGKFCGNSVPKAFEITSNLAIVLFSTDSSVTGPGFKLEWTANGYGEESLKSSRRLWRDGPCSYDQFRCLNDRCISKYQFCNGHNECGDNSDEQHCGVTSCPLILTRFRCHHYHNDRCIPLTWLCDGQNDCLRKADEERCGTVGNAVNLKRIFIAKRLALKWIIEGRNNERLSNKWGVQVARRAIARYLGDQEKFVQNKTLMSEMAYEVSLNVLSRVIQNSLKGVSSTELATHVNALLVTCVDTRNFYGMNLVSELRERADATNETHPSVTLALCNAGDVIDYNDVAKTVNVFRIAQRNHRTDIEALAVLALSCAAAKDQDLLEGVNMTELTSELKKNQFDNGTVESPKTTTLVMQALYAAERDYGEGDFDEVKALLQILKSQMPDGSFGNTANTYYALPVLAYKSLVNISSSHCSPRINDSEFTGRIADENGSLQYLLNMAGRKSTVRFSLWIGINKTLERTITLRIPSNTSFYGFMEWAARVDPQFKFKYSMRETKPYIYSISGIQDDPENSLFWLLYSIGSSGDEKPTLIMKSPADVFPTNGQHLVFWYKTG